MAATSVCTVAKTVLGDMRCHIFSCTVGANTTMAFDTGLKPIHYHTWTKCSAATNAGLQCFKNKGALGTSLAGYIAITGATNGDDITVVSFGK
jgi:hypothetical protein